MKSKSLITKNLGLLIILILILGSVVTFLPAKAQTTDTIYSGYGTATIDGYFGPDEWEHANIISFDAKIPSHDGGGTIPAELYIMNDDDHLYLGIKIGRASFGAATNPVFNFDLNNNGVRDIEDEHIGMSVGIYSGIRVFDGFYTNQPPCSSGSVCGFSDTDYGGSNDVFSSASYDGDFTYIELSHPLDSFDDIHDMSLSPGDTTGFVMDLRLFSMNTSCSEDPYSNCYADTSYPAYGYISIVTAQQALIVPNSLATSEGNSTSGYPFNLNWSNKSSIRFQQVFNASEFSSLDGPQIIKQISFRPDWWHGQPFSTTIPEIQINMSTTNKMPDKLSGHFQNNIGEDETVVYKGELSLSSLDDGPYSGPKDFDIVIDLQTPFIYNPNVGNLLLDIRNFSNSSTTLFDSQSVMGDSISTVFSWNDDGVDQENGVWTTWGLVTKFTIGSLPNVPAISVNIDIKPGSDPNCFNSDGNGVIPISVLGSSDFDVSTIVPGSISLDGEEVRVKGKSGNAGWYEDSNQDGFQDLVVQISDDGVYSFGETTAVLNGYTYEGIPIEGSDIICITQ